VRNPLAANIQTEVDPTSGTPHPSPLAQKSSLSRANDTSLDDVRKWVNCTIAYAASAIVWKPGRQFNGMSSSQRATGQLPAILAMTSAI
jgi:hypothetical protein